uniref:Rhomboid family intramembrane serine protease n=2 Tax=Thermofilum pendens TaxID=2269 RepID=A0A7J3X6Q3_THEPE
MVYSFPQPHEELISRKPYVTIGLVIANVVVYAITSAEYGFFQISESWTQWGAFVPSLLSRPEHWYRLFTSMFLHGNLFHIFFNMIFLYGFGKHVESVLGAWRYLVLYFLSGLLAEVFHTAFLPIEGAFSAHVPALGASGAISGVLGAYLLLFPGTRLHMCVFYFFIPICFTTRASAFLIFWFAMQILQGYLGESLGVAVFAHAGGFVGGLALLPLLLPRERVEMLRIHTRLRSFFFDIFPAKPGLSAGSKAVLVALLLAVVAGAAYCAATAPEARNVVKVLTVSVGYKGVEESESIIVLLDRGRLSISPIVSSGVRVVVNRLNALGLIYSSPSAGRTLSVSLSKSARVQGIPVGVSLEAELCYDEWGLLSSGRGSMDTDVLYCTYYGCSVGGRETYSFSASTESVSIGFQGIPVAELSLLVMIPCIVAIAAVMRAEEFEIFHF